MYQQDTCFEAANTPLFTQLFGSACAGVRVPRKEIVEGTSGRQTRHLQHQFPVAQETPVLLESADRLQHGSVEPRHFGAVPNAPLESFDCDYSSSAPQKHLPLLNASSLSSGKPDDDGVDDISEMELQEPKGPALPFRQVMRELERRFQEQIELHLALNTSMKKLDHLSNEVSLYQSEQRTIKLACLLGKESLLSLQTTAAAAVSPPVQGAAVPSPLTPHKRVLESCAMDHGNTVSFSGASQLVTERRPLRVEVVRPAEKPRPYKRIIYVPIVKQVEDTGGSASSGPQLGSILSITSDAEAAAAAAAEPFSTTASYSNDFNSSGGVSTDISVATSTKGNTAVTTISTIADSTPSSSTLSVTDERRMEAASSSATRKQRISEGNAPLLEMLHQFDEACSVANRLIHGLIGPDGTVTEMSARQRKLGAKNDVSDGGEGHPTCLADMRRDVGDVRKLRRFVDHLKRNIMALDVGRKTRETRRRLLIKAQRLARARQQMLRDKKTLSDVMDDIADLIKDDVSHDDSNVLDEAPSPGATSLGSISDEVFDDVVDGIADEGSDMINDEVVDEFQEANTRGSDLNDDVLDEVAGNLSWVQDESDFADALAQASDIEDILENEVPLPSDNTTYVVVADDVSFAASSMATIISENERVSVASRLGGLSGSTSASLNVILFSDASDPEDADVSSVIPASTATIVSLTSDSSNIRRTSAASEDDGIDSLEGAFAALQHDLQLTAPRRALSLLSVQPSSFTQLYTVNGSDSHSISDEKEKGDGEDLSVLHTGMASIDGLSHPGKQEVSFVTPGVPEVEAPHSRTSVTYASDDLVAQLGWKERQLTLFRHLRPNSVCEVETGATDASLPIEEQAEYHWGMVETLVQYRFGNAPSVDDDFCTESSWTDDCDEHGEYSGRSFELLADAEYSTET